MNEPGLEGVIQGVEEKIETTKEDAKPIVQRFDASQRDKLRLREENRYEDYNEEDEELASIYQPTLWWFTSTAFPLVAGTFGPIANLFSICALIQTWRVGIDDGRQIPDPSWMIALNICSLVLALAANVILLFNFARRIRYSIAQTLTISFWYTSCIFLIIPICLTRDPKLDAYLQPSTMAYSQSFFYALISGILHFTISSVLLISTLGAVVFRAYPPSFSTLTIPQRTLMLQTISFSLYLALGGGVFSAIENWGFTDGIYWADYTVLTIGLGTDFPLTKTLARMLLIPYAAFGITLIGLVVNSVRGLVLERAKAKVARRHLGKERERWKHNIKERRRMAAVQEMAASTKDSQISSSRQDLRKERQLLRLPHQLAKRIPTPLYRSDLEGKWHRAEFELMRFIEFNSERAERYMSLTVSFFIILIVWIGGSLVFWVCERLFSQKKQSWTYPESFYFSYTTLLTIGYGDFYPSSAAGKPFFVVWSLISVPAMTVLISNMGDTVVKWIQNGTEWACQWTILPEKKPEKKKADRRKHRRGRSKKRHVHPEVTHDYMIGGHSGPSDEPHGATPDTDSPSERKPIEGSPRHPENKESFLQRDVERLGDAIEHFEEEEGRRESLTAKIATEISSLAKDLNAKPPKKYSWEEWVHWLGLLGEREYDTEGRLRMPESSTHANGDSDHKANLRLTVPPILDATISSIEPTDSDRMAIQIHDSPPSNEAELDARRKEALMRDLNDADWRWTWLDDQGPLFSKLTETEWVIEKLCFRLEAVLEQEIRDARNDSKN